MRRSSGVEQAIEAWSCPLQTSLDLILVLPTCNNFSPFLTNVTPFALLSHVLLTPQSQQGMGNALWHDKRKLPVLNWQDLQDTPPIRPDVPHQPQSGLQWRQPHSLLSSDLIDMWHVWKFWLHITYTSRIDLQPSLQHQKRWHTTNKHNIHSYKTCGLDTLKAVYIE